MTREETKGILEVVKAAWPHSFAGKTARELTAILELWAAMFADEKAGLVGAAVKAIICDGTVKYAPTIGEVKDKIALLTQPREMDEAEAWALVAKAIRNGAYDAQREFEALPDNVRRIVGSHNQLHDWALMDSDTVQSVVASNFQRAYRTRAKADKQYAALPQSVVAALAEYGVDVGVRRLEA